MQDEALVASAAAEMHVKVPEKVAVPSFAEKYFLWLENRQQRASRRRADVSRRINSGLVVGGSQPVMSHLLPARKKEEKNEPEQTGTN